MLTALVALGLCGAFLVAIVLGYGFGSPEEPPLAVIAQRPFALAPAFAPRVGFSGVAMAVQEPGGDPEPGSGGSVAPAPEPPEQELDPEALELEAWRRDQFVELGIGADEAEEAARAGVDASSVRSLVEQGCEPELALRILR